MVSKLMVLFFYEVVNASSFVHSDLCVFWAVHRIIERIHMTMAYGVCSTLLYSWEEWNPLLEVRDQLTIGLSYFEYF